MVILPVCNEQGQFCQEQRQGQKSGESGGQSRTCVNADRAVSGPAGARDLAVVSRGSALNLCMVAAGEADLYPRLAPTMEWDTAAAQCVVEQAGGRVTTLGNEPLRYNEEDLLNPFFMVASPGAASLWPACL